jgi:MoxR-like ATPase
MSEDTAWWIYQGTGKKHDDIKEKLPTPPPWRQFTKQANEERGAKFKPSVVEIELVNAAFFLRRPLLITGKPGVGKTTLAYAVAYELELGNVLRWSITTNSKLKDGLYSYDAIGRLQDTSLQENQVQKRGWFQSKTQIKPPDISQYLRLGPLGTALAAKDKPRVLLIDEIDKSDIDLPNNLLHIFEEGEFLIPELERLKEKEYAIPNEDNEKVLIEQGRVHCETFPLVILTSNGEREFSPAFLRRCLQLEMQLPDADKLTKIIEAHLKFSPEQQEKIKELIKEFLNRRDQEKCDLATDQLLNAVYMVLKDVDPRRRDLDEFGKKLLDTLWKSLSG